MKKLFLFFTIITCCFSLYAQPAFIGTALETGSYSEIALTDLGAFRQARLQALNSGSGREWNFIQSSGNFTINWRPYTLGQTLSGYNTVIDPGTQNASARYNSSTGGQPGLLPFVQAGNYYTINITEFAPPANQLMAVLEANWCNTCRLISTVSGTGCLDECGYEVTVTMAQAPAANEYVYVRYSTNGFSTSSLVQVSFSGGTIGTATIPGQGAGIGVDYYVYSSNRTLAQIQTEVSTHGEVAHDLMTVNLNNNGGSNYSVSACTNYEKNLVITEIMPDPDAVTDANGEYLEIYNAGAHPVDMQGYIIKDNGSNSHTISSSLVVSPGSYVIIGKNGSSASNGGLSVDYVASSSFTLGNNDDEVIILCGTYEIDRVEYDRGNNGWPNSAGVSMSLNPTKLNDVDNNTGSNWFDAVCPYGNGDLGTPGATNETSDVTDPTAICQSTVVNLDAGGNAVLLTAAIDGGSSDACSSITLAANPNSFTCVDLGTPNVVLTVTDAAGNSASCNASVTVNDPTGACAPPYANCKNATVDLDPNGQYTLAASEVNNGSSASGGIALMTVTPNTFDCTSIASNDHTVTLLVENAGGDQATCTASVTVQDKVAPSMLCVSATTVSIDPTGNASISHTDINNGSSDNCNIANLSVTPNNFTCANLGNNTVTLTGTDVSSNAATCTANVTIADPLNVCCAAPVALCQAATLELDANGEATLAVSDVDAGSSAGCGLASITVSPSSFDCGQVGAIPVTLLVTDVNGNTANCNSTVTVTDDQAPVALCQDVTLALDACGLAFLAPSAVNAGSSDNCGITSTSLDNNLFSCGGVYGDLFFSEYIEGSSSNKALEIYNPRCVAVNMSDYVLYRYNNGSLSPTDSLFPRGLLAPGDVYVVGNPSAAPGIQNVDDTTHTMTFYNGDDAISLINRTTGDTLDIIGEIGVDPGSGWQVGTGATNNYTLVRKSTVAQGETDWTISVGQWDVYPIDDFSFLGSHTYAPGALIPNTAGPVPVVLTVSDAAGSTSSCQANVTLQDNPPVALCQDGTAVLGVGNVTISPSLVDNGSSDDCGSVSLSVSPNNFSCSQEGQTKTVTLTVTDNNNNVSTCTADVHVDDQTLPTAICKNITVQLDASGQKTIARGDVDNGSSDNCGFAPLLSVSPDNFTCSHIGNNTVTLRVGDGNGNQHTCTATVTVEDVSPPTALCQDITVTLDNTGNVSIVGSDVDAASTDACGIATSSVSPSVFDCNDIGSNTVTLTVTDIYGNMATCTADVTVNWDPVSFSAAPRPVCQNGTVSFTDNSQDAVAWSWDFGDGSAGSTQQNPTHVFPAGDTGRFDVTLTITTSDGCMFTKEIGKYIRVEQPVADFSFGVDSCFNPPNILVFLTDQSILPDTWNWNFGDANTSTLQNPVHSYTSAGVYTISLTVQDTINGCLDVITKTLNLGTTDPPAVICQDATISLDINGQATLVAADVNGGSSDDCGIVSMSVSPRTFDCNHLRNNQVVTLSVSDAHNQNDQCTATVTVSDPLSACCDAPVAQCQPITVQLDANGQYSLAASEVDNGSSADCGGLELEVTPSELDCGDIGVAVVTLRASDINEDVDQCTANVTIRDNRPPAFFTQACSTSNATGTAYADGWDNGDNDGSGFLAWGFVMSPGSAGTFRGDSRLNGTPGGVINDPNQDGDINTNGFALGLFANSGSSVDARRTLQTPLPVGGKFSLAFDNGNIDANEAVSVVFLTNTVQRLFDVRFVGGQNNYKLEDNNGSTNFNSIGFTDQGLTIEVEILNRFQANVTLTRLVDNVSQSLLANFETPNKLLGQIRVLNLDAGNGQSNDLYINSLAACYPVSGCPGNISVNTDPGQCGATVTYAEVLASDNCTASLTVTQTSGQASGTLFPAGPTTNTFSVTDANGNTATCSFSVTVTENEPPTVTCQDVTVSLDANGQVSVPVSNTPLANSVADFSGVQGTNGWEYGMHSAFDYAGFTPLPNFTGSVWNNPGATLDFPQIDFQGGHPNLDNLRWAVRRWTSNITGSIRITGDFFDRNGNCGDGAHVRIFKNGTEIYQYLNVPTTSVSYDLTIPINASDHIDFVIDPIFNASCDDTHFTAQISSLGNTSSYDDNCGIASVSASRSTFSCTDIGSHTITMTVTDVNNNTATCTSEVTVVDALAPVAKCQDVTVQLDANGQYQFAASEADNGSSDNCQLTSVTVNGFTNFTLGCAHANAPNSASFRATDASGNFSACTFTITTLDVTPPTAICQPATIVLSAVDGTGSITAADVDGGSSDACTISSLSVSPSTFDCSMVGANTVTLTVTDKFGNTADCATTVFVDDSQSKPATLAQQSCGNCGFIRIFYCQFDPAPAALNDFIDGTVDLNANYVAGNTLYWYDDNSGSPGGAHLGTGQEPATPNMNLAARTYWYWVAQIDQNTGCFGDPIRVRVRVRKTPTPVFVAPPTPYCEGASLNLAGQVDDPNNVADSFSFYDGDPNNGGTLLGTVTATNGSVDAGQSVAVTPVVGSNTYWVVATNQGNNNTITCPATTSMTFVVSPTPVLSPIQDVNVCPGDQVSVTFSSTPSQGAIYIWLNNNTNIGLGANGITPVNFTAAPNTSGAPEVGNLSVRAYVNGCASNVESFDITVNPVAIIDPASGVTACSGQPTGMVLNTILGSPQATAYNLVSVTIDQGLIPDPGNFIPPAQGVTVGTDQFKNKTAGVLNVVYGLQSLTAAGCLSDVQTVTVSILPEPVIPSGLADTVCSGQAANLPLSTVNNLPGTSFSWTPQSLPTGISLSSSSSPGTVLADVLINNTASPIDVIYDITATAGACGSVVVPCTIRVVPFPLVPPTASLHTCEDLNTPGVGTFNLTSLDAIIGGGLTVSYFTDPNLLTQIPTPGAFVSGATTVYASVASPNNRCPNRTDISLTVTSLALPQVSSSSFPCDNTSQEIIPVPVVGVSFNFYDNDPHVNGLLLSSGASYDPMLAVGQSQTIWVTATDGVCESDAVPTTVTILAAPAASISSNMGNGGICEGDTLELFGSGGGTYSWTGPNGFSSTQQNVRIEGFVLADTGEYILTVSNGNCSRPDTIYVVGTRKANAGQNGTLTIAANAQPVDLFNYLQGTPQPGGVWAGPSAPYNGDQGTFNPNFMFSGVYTYTLTNPAPCQDSVSISTVTVNVTPVTAVKVRARVYLEGVLDTTTFRMQDSLRQNLYMPTFEPYSALGYVHVNGGGSESFPVEQLDTTGNNALVDWVIMELRDQNDSTHIVATRSVLLQRDGDVVDLDGVSPVCFNRVTPGFYYVVIGHRNHLFVMSGIPLLLNSTGTINLDFTSGVLPVFGTLPQNTTATTVVAGGVRVMIGGDADFNGQIQNSDDVSYWAPTVGGSGYRKADYDCSGQVQNNDRVFIWSPNVGKGTQVPLRSN